MTLPANNHQRKIIAAALQSSQIGDPANLSLAHNIGLFHYWWAKTLEEEGQLELAGEAWLTVISNWAIVLSDDTFLQAWCKRRSDVYQTGIAQDDIGTLRNQLHEKLRADLTDYTERCERAGQIFFTEPLYLVFELEIAASQTMKLVGGFPIPSNASNRIACGPLMLRRLDLAAAFGEFLFDHKPVAEGVPDVLADLFVIVKGKRSGSLDDARRIKLMQYFSQLGVAALCLDRSEPDQTLSFLGALSPHLNDPAGAQQSAGQLPLAFDDRSAGFGERNPGYLQAKDSGKTMFEHAVRLALTAQMCVAELNISADPMDLKQAMMAWQAAIALSRELDLDKQTITDIQKMIVGRARALKRTKRLDEAIALLETTVNAYPGDTLERKLAELLTHRGIIAGNNQQWESSVIDLRRAYGLDPFMPHTRNNFATALRALAAEAFAVDHLDRSKALLAEAIAVLEAAIEADPNDPDLREKLGKMQSDMAENLFKEGGLDEAEEEAQKAVQAIPKRKKGLIILSRIYARKKNIEGVIETRHQIVELDPSEKFSAEINIGQVCQVNERYDDALDHFWEAAIAASDDEERSLACELMASVLIAQKRFDEAETVVERVLKLSPDNERARTTLLHLQLHLSNNQL